MRTFYGSISLALCWLLYISLAHVLDREGVTGALLAPGTHSAAALVGLGMLVVLRFASLVVLPALLVGWVLSRLGERVMQRFQARSR